MFPLGMAKTNKPKSFAHLFAVDNSFNVLRSAQKIDSNRSKERRIIQDLLPGLSNSVQILFKHQPDGRLEIHTDSAGVASRIRFIAPQLQARLGLANQSISVRCVPVSTREERQYWKGNVASDESGKVLLEVAEGLNQQLEGNEKLASALKKLARSITSNRG